MNSNKVAAFGVVGGIVFILGLILLMTSLVWSIPAGHLGVVNNMGQLESTLEPGGPYFVKPWKSVKEVNVQTRRVDENASLPTKGGLPVGVRATLLYKVSPDKVIEILKEYGQDYEKIVENEFTSGLRDAAGEFAPEAFSTSDRPKLEGRAVQLVTEKLKNRGFIVDGVNIQDPQLPQSVKAAIEAKTAAEQEAIQMQSIFLKRELEGKANKRVEELKAESKVIEAEGIAKAQNIIKKDLTHEYLVYLWIQALRDNNNSTVYVPTGNDGMPFFKDVKPASK